MTGSLEVIEVTVVFSPQPRVVREWTLTVPAGASVEQALLKAEGLSAALLEAGLPATLSSCEIGVWNKPAALGDVLRPLDRIEIYRPLKVDPKVARRERFEKQGKRSTGLFARKPSQPASAEEVAVVTGTR